MENDFYYIELFMIYGELLTEKQREMFSMHYDLDLSLAEIAEDYGATRQSVHDAIKKVKDKLREFEKVLKIKEKNDELTALADKINGEVAEKIKDIIGK